MYLFHYWFACSIADLCSSWLICLFNVWFVCFMMDVVCFMFEVVACLFDLVWCDWVVCLFHDWFICFIIDFIVCLSHAWFVSFIIEFAVLWLSCLFHDWFVWCMIDLFVSWWILMFVWFDLIDLFHCRCWRACIFSILHFAYAPGLACCWSSQLACDKVAAACSTSIRRINAVACMWLLCLASDC